MKNKISLLLSCVALVATVITAITACNKKFDEPAGPSDPNITPNTTIKALKAMHAVGGAYDAITTDVIISGIVVADDKSGNLYKNIYIQDATGAINILLDATNLYNTYPVGRKVFINCKGLYISDYNRMIQLGMRSVVNGVPSLEGIPSGLIANYVTGGSINNTVAPKVVTVAALTTNMQDDYLGSLIQLDGYEFVKGDTSKTYADTSAYKNSVNLTITNCGNTAPIIIRTSGYCNFAAQKPAQGNGSVAAIYTTFNTTRQLLLRDPSDVKFTTSRCNLFEEDFEAYPTTGTAALVIPGWKNIMETGDVPYTLAAFSGNEFAKVSAFGSVAQQATTNISSWLISPDITIPAALTAAKYTFTCSRRYTAGTFKAFVSTNYTGGAPSTATWTLLTTVPAGTQTAFTPFDAFGPYNFGIYAGQKVNVAFQYQVNAGVAQSTVGTYEPDDIKVTKN
jgi:Family of unknown function (DUF5689)